jgi:AcrR family transcriptional regulator
MSTAARGEVSPNQAEKQRQIIEAAKLVLVRDGLAACSARAVADASPLSKSAIHYYFADLDEIIDQAMASHVDAFVEAIRAESSARSSPPEMFWAAVDTYVALFVEYPNSLALWHEYWIDGVRRGRVEPIRDMFASCAAIFTVPLRACGIPDPELRAHALTSLLVGAVTQQAIAPVPLSELHREVAALCLVAPPAAEGKSA